MNQKKAPSITKLFHYLLYLTIFANILYLKIYIRNQIAIFEPTLTSSALSNAKHGVDALLLALTVFVLREILKLKTTSITLVSIVSIFNIYYFLYFGYFGTIPHLLQIKNAVNINEISYHIIYHALQWQNITYILSNIASIILIITTIHKTFKTKKIIILTYTILTTTLTTFNYLKFHRNDYNFSRNACFVKYGYPTTILMDLKNTFFKPEKSNYPGTINIDTPTNAINPKIKNIIILQVESLDDSTLKVLRNSYLSQLKKQSIYYENFYSQHSGGGSSDAELSSLYSLLPLKEFAGLNAVDAKKIISLPTILKEDKYHLSWYHAYSAEFFNRKYAYKNMGFDDIHDMSFYKDKAAGWYSKDYEFLSQTFQVISKTKQPFFSYIITIQSHGPFENHGDSIFSYLKMIYGKTYTTSQINLLSAITEVDNAIKYFVETFKRSPLYENSALVIFGDHESQLFKSPTSKDHVPLFIITKNIKPHTISDPCSHLDIAPIVLNLIGKQQLENYHWLGTPPNNQNRKIIFNDLIIGKKINNKMYFYSDTNFYKFVKYSEHLLL